MTQKKSIAEILAPAAEDLASSILLPPITVDSFEINPLLIQWITDNCQFEGSEEDNPYEHLRDFLQICSTFKIHQVSEDAIRLRLFPFSLKTKAKEWLRSLPRDSITTWDELVEKFLAHYFPYSKTRKYRAEISNFQQAEFESLYDAWQRYKSILRKCPNHCFNRSNQVQIFYNGLCSNIQEFVYISTGGSVISSPAEAYDLIDRLATTDDQWYASSDERFNKRQTEIETLRQQLNELGKKLNEVYVGDPSLVYNRHMSYPNHYTSPQYAHYARYPFLE